MRKHISQAIVRRSAALRTALNTYNQLAQRQSPPAPVLEYAQVASYGWLNDFELLKNSRYGVLSKPWAQPVNREHCVKYHKVLRAREELVRLNVEIHRLHAWVEHEDQQLSAVATKLSETQPMLSKEITWFAVQRRRVNDEHRIRLHAIYNLPEYCGPGPYASNNTPHGPEVELELQDKSGVNPDEDDAACDEMLRLGDCLDRLQGI